MAAGSVPADAPKLNAPPAAAAAADPLEAGDASTLLPVPALNAPKPNLLPPKEPLFDFCWDAPKPAESPLKPKLFSLGRILKDPEANILDGDPVSVAKVSAAEPSEHAHKRVGQ